MGLLGTVINYGEGGGGLHDSSGGQVKIDLY